jgi:DNA-binding NarL/FixJ family response regulator
MSATTLPTSSTSASSAAARAALIVGDDQALRGNAAAWLAATGFTVAGEGDERPLRRAEELAVVVLLSRSNARERIARVGAAAETFGAVPVLATMPAEATGTELRMALRAGAAGIVLDDQLQRTLGPTALAIASGQLAGPMSLARRLAPRALSFREREILGLVVRGYTNRQIAGELFVAESTVKSHLSSSLRKLDARSRAEAAALILDPEEGYGPGILSGPGDETEIDARHDGGDLR